MKDLEVDEETLNKVILYLKYTIENEKIHDTYIGYDYDIPSERVRGMEVILNELQSGKWKSELKSFLEENEEE